jgi:hypothetical protein
MVITKKMNDNGILRMHNWGDFDNVREINRQSEITPFLEASNLEHPLKKNSTKENIGKVSFTSRKYFAEIYKCPGLGLFGIFNPPHVMHIFGRFIITTIKKVDIKFSSSETQANAWIKSQ